MYFEWFKKNPIIFLPSIDPLVLLIETNFFSGRKELRFYIDLQFYEHIFDFNHIWSNFLPNAALSTLFKFRHNAGLKKINIQL